ncbi:MAG TPA: hypothetical protein VF609_14490 [Flavisolibacter sp.]|jgi:predicted Zn-dependent protease with MMP-like domain
MPNKFDKLVAEAAELADKEFKNQFTNLTRLNDAETENIIRNTGISQQDLAKVLKEVKDATASNEAKANAIKKINNGVAALVAIAQKLV